MAVMWPYRATPAPKPLSCSSRHTVTSQWQSVPCYTQLHPWEGDREVWRELLECCHGKWNKMQRGFSLFSSSFSVFKSLYYQGEELRTRTSRKHLGEYEQCRLGDQFGVLGKALWCKTHQAMREGTQLTPCPPPFCCHRWNKQEEQWFLNPQNNFVLCSYLFVRYKMVSAVAEGLMPVSL